MLVQKLRANIKKNVNLDELANGANKKRMIEKVNGYQTREVCTLTKEKNRLLWMNYITW